MTRPLRRISSASAAAGRLGIRYSSSQVGVYSVRVAVLLGHADHLQPGGEGCQAGPVNSEMTRSTLLSGAGSGWV